VEKFCLKAHNSKRVGSSSIAWIVPSREVAPAKKTTEVFQMDEYEIYYVNKAIEACDRAKQANEGRHSPWRSKNRMWDYVIGTVCCGCGKLLGRYENLNRLAFCSSCRRILFPETVHRENRLRH
jgi:hypothetical protein